MPKLLPPSMGPGRSERLPGVPRGVPRLPRPGVPSGVLEPCCILKGGIPSGGPLFAPDVPLGGPTGNLGLAVERNVAAPGGAPGGAPRSPSGGRNAGRGRGGAAGGGLGGALLESGALGACVGIAGLLGAGFLGLSSGSLAVPACPRIRLLRKSPAWLRRRISNLLNSTIVVTAQRITSRRRKSRAKPMPQARYQCVSSARPNFVL
mmetsp:Transcript_38585/g.96908  ORF Transcript_38585/g.96908 Transcript_38585/m.96908 type:complete len:206 (-) Transcript_38585:465-1082(-)